LPNRRLFVWTKKTAKETKKIKEHTEYSGWRKFSQGNARRKRKGGAASKPTFNFWKARACCTH